MCIARASSVVRCFDHVAFACSSKGDTEEEEEVFGIARELTATQSERATGP